MKRFLFLALTAVLVVGLFLAGCSSPAPAPAPTVAPSQTAAPAPTAATPAPSATPTTSAPANQKTWNLRMAHGQSLDSYYNKYGWQPWADAVAKATNGRVKVTIFPNDVLFPTTQTWEGVKTGIADVTYMNSAYFSAITELTDVSTLPFVIPSGEIGSKAVWNLVQKYPEMQAQFNDAKLLSIWATEPYFFISNGRLYKTLSDFQGQKFRMAGGPATDMMKLLGGTAMTFSMSDSYMNMQKGVINGAAVPSEAVVGFKFYEVATNYTYVPTVAGRNRTLRQIRSFQISDRSGCDRLHPRPQGQNEACIPKSG
jgi:TRAP-type C4-dicarboxylate transport system substrate-binding protein